MLLKLNGRIFCNAWKLIVMWQRGHISDALYAAEVREERKEMAKKNCRWPTERTA